MEESQLTGKILEAAFEVSNTLGAGFLEKVYENALMIALNERQLSVKSQAPLEVRYHGRLVGEYFVDILVNNRIILELKSVSALTPEHHAQTLNYLKASHLPVAILINFGTPKISYRRFAQKFKSP